MKLSISVDRLTGTRDVTLAVREAVIAGWTGRDHAAVERHISELEAVGVPRPPTTPVYYRVAAARLTHAKTIEVTGPDSSGEIEFVLVGVGGETCVGIGSDHTDRKLETYSVTASKQLCDKPVSKTFWPLAEVVAHWDQLMLRSYATVGGKRALYQEGTVANMLPPGDLIRGYAASAAGLPEGIVMFCGTLPAIGGVRPAEHFDAEIEDPVMHRRIDFGYGVRTLPSLG